MNNYMEFKASRYEAPYLGAATNDNEILLVIY